MDSISPTTSNHKPTLCFFGLGALFESCYPQLVVNVGGVPDVLCDNASSKWGRHFFGRPCVPPEILANEFGLDTHILVCTRNYESICAQLEKVGFTNIFVACFDRSHHSYQVVCRIKSASTLLRSDHSIINNNAINVRGRQCLITGASRGIGREIALAMAKLGTNLILHARQVEHLQEVSSKCIELGVNVKTLAADLSVPKDFDSLLNQCDHVEPIDILFNNAAISPFTPDGFWYMTANTFELAFRVNAIAPIQLCQKLIPGMISRGFGRIVSLSSSIQGRPDEMAYACSKAALDKFVFDLQPTLDSSNVMLTLVDPGWTQTDMGTYDAPNTVQSVIPGAILPALMNQKIGGRWFDAQDYSGMDLESALNKASNQLV